jgi:Domain of unknown function DUF11
MRKIHYVTGTKRRFAAMMAAIAGLGVVTGIAITGGSTVAGASGTADLSARQVVSNGTGSTSTTVTDHIHNAGPSTATSIVATALLKTAGGSVSYTTSNATCEQQPAPSGWSFMFTCQLASLQPGHTWIPKFTLTSTQGAPFTRFLSVGENGPGDPSLANNSSTLNSYFGAEADLSLSQIATAGSSSGKVTITDSIRNKGPWTADNLQQVIEINSPTFGGVIASSIPSGASCQFIPPAAGFNAAASCTFNALAPGKLWKLTFAYTGGAGGSLVQQGTISAGSPGDPVATNNTATISTHYHS